MVETQQSGYYELDFDDPNLVINILKLRRNMNKNTIIVIVGETRSGKSYAAMKIAERINPDWKVEDSLFFDIQPFLEKIRSAFDDIFVLDEVSISMGARDWFDVQHKIINNFLTTQTN